MLLFIYLDLTKLLLIDCMVAFLATLYGLVPDRQNHASKCICEQAQERGIPDLDTNKSGAIIKYLFREARRSKALLFFDECESIFMSPDKQGSSVSMILTELERFDDL